MTRFVFSLLFCVTALPVWAQPIHLYAAASLGDVLDEAVALFEDRFGHPVTLTLASSAALARHIQHGAPADAFVSANVAWVDHLQTQGHVDHETRADIAGNRLAIVSADPAATIDAFLDGTGRIAVALTNAVPAGIYAQEALVSLGAWPTVQPRLVETDSVRSALALVATGAVRYGIVYTTDARSDARISWTVEIDATAHRPIRYTAAQVRGGDDRGLLAWLVSPEVQTLFAEHGFTP